MSDHDFTILTPTGERPATEDEIRAYAARVALMAGVTPGEPVPYIAVDPGVAVDGSTVTIEWHVERPA